MILANAAANWSPGPLYVAAQPYLLSIFDDVLLPLVLGWIAYLAQRYLGIVVNQAALKRVHDAAESAAGRVLANGDDTIANLSIPITSPLVAAEVPFVERVAADAIKELGMTPDRVAALIQGKIGQLQARALAGATVIATKAVS